MRIIKQSVDWEQMPPGNTLKIIEKAGRTCYKSEAKAAPGSAEKFVKMLISRGHMAMIEHVSASVRIITNRGVSHELVRHRLASYAQESTRYVNYNGDMEFIRPVWLDIKTGNYNYSPEGKMGVFCVDGIPEYDIENETDEKILFIDECRGREEQYKNFLGIGWRPEQAREILPNSLKTEIVMTANLREWRTVFGLRCASTAHPQMRTLMRKMLAEFYEAVPVIFDDLFDKYGSD